MSGGRGAVWVAGESSPIRMSFNVALVGADKLCRISWHPCGIHRPRLIQCCTLRCTAKLLIQKLILLQAQDSSTGHSSEEYYDRQD